MVNVDPHTLNKIINDSQYAAAYSAYARNELELVLMGWPYGTPGRVNYNYNKASGSYYTAIKQRIALIGDGAPFTDDAWEGRE